MTGTLYWLFVMGFYYFFVMHGNALLSSVLYVYVKKKKNCELLCETSQVY